MTITLPTEPLPAVSDLSGTNLLFEGDYGIGKSGLLASTGYLILDPEDKMKSYPNVLRVTVKTWQDHKQFVELVSKEKPGTFPGIGLDSLNVSYDQCLAWVMANVKFAGSWLTHPSENPQIAYPRITHEFITWLRSVTLLGYHVIATCHVNVVEIRNKKGDIYNRWIPAFTGGSPTSSYANVLKVFPIVGFMTLDEVDRPPTRAVMGKQVVDTRADASRIGETEEKLVIYFKQDTNWLANNKFGAFPDRVVLSDRWQDDWKTLKDAWGYEGHTMEEEPIEGPGIELTGAPTGAEASGLQ